MSLDVVLLGGYTARAQAYAQAMARAGFNPSHVILYGAAKPVRIANNTSGMLGELALPDLSESLADTCARMHWPIETIVDEDVNSPAIRAALDALRPGLVVYCGYGGQILRQPLLDLGFPFIHSHSGWLPGYRGSTTIYYSMLAERRCAVSVLLLEAQIDAGPVLARRHYPLPPADLDIDYLYDTAIRADLLIAVLRDCQASQQLPRALNTDAEPGETYFVIHPVLKHLALLSLARGKSGAPTVKV